MHTCKSCIKEIETGATKCPYCQAYQVWYKNPQNYSFIFMLPLFIFIFWNTGSFNKKDFLDYESKFTFTKEKIIDVGGSKAKLITFNVTNNTEYKWNHISYEVISKKNGELLASTSDSIYSWVIQPNSESLLTVKAPFIANANEWQLKIKDLKSDRY
ncbi:hypothetical protein CXF83_17295 [Shewanella sp. Choline-02u-19]|uniref:hypothetical protein n=1 Tax=unclassified Shewanella TaxID=196818 RepID=UPI000C332397|nr:MULTISPECIES: hypothetical protein [unclassified Shewanella]PKG57103.1 hypothetical protein CXF82_11685 [Shewanella sp. GutDb-MelDb]PKH57369.1 hypothetical protein CXF84_08610 [Shewanella sp. Bg11-22]PKI28330.1 hypothetical protein CXF83_17295 [Shewanella sp. Choline-02u-19]